MTHRIDIGSLILIIGTLAGCADATDATAAGSEETNSPPDEGETETVIEESDTGDTESTSYENTGICGMSIEATVTESTFDGREDIYLIGNEGGGPDICRVRYTLRAAGAPAVPCDICEWAFELERTAPEMTANVDDGCASSELSMDSARIEEQDGTRVSWGYATEATGHAHVLMEWNESTNQWTAVAVAAWNESDGTLLVDRRDGYCSY